MTALEIAMDKARTGGLGDGYSPSSPDISEGMCCIFEDTPLSKPVAIVTVVFARKFCAEDPYYTWRKL